MNQEQLLKLLDQNKKLFPYDNIDFRIDLQKVNLLDLWDITQNHPREVVKYLFERIFQANPDLIYVPTQVITSRISKVIPILEKLGYTNIYNGGYYLTVSYKGVIYRGSNDLVIPDDQCVWFSRSFQEALKFSSGGRVYKYSIEIDNLIVQDFNLHGLMTLPPPQILHKQFNYDTTFKDMADATTLLQCGFYEGWVNPWVEDQLMLCRPYKHLKLLETIEITFSPFLEFSGITHVPFSQVPEEFYEACNFNWVYKEECRYFQMLNTLKFFRNPRYSFIGQGKYGVVITPDLIKDSYLYISKVVSQPKPLVEQEWKFSVFLQGYDLGGYFSKALYRHSYDHINEEIVEYNPDLKYTLFTQYLFNVENDLSGVEDYSFESFFSILQDFWRYGVHQDIYNNLNCNGDELILLDPGRGIIFDNLKQEFPDFTEWEFLECCLVLKDCEQFSMIYNSDTVSKYIQELTEELNQHVSREKPYIPNIYSVLRNMGLLKENIEFFVTNY